jgi:HK97 family phage major capsid protein
MRKPLDVLERDLAATQEKARALFLATAKTCDAEDNRLMTAAEVAAIETLTAEGAAIKKQITEQSASAAMLAEIDRLTAGVSPLPARGSARILSIGQQLVANAEWQDFIKRQGHRTASSWRSPMVELFPPDFHAATLTEDPASGGALVTPQYLPGIQGLPTRPIVVADLLAPGTTDSNAVSYMREKTFTNAAAPVLEGGIKPESTLVFEAALDPVRKIAHWLPVTEEMLEDVPQMRSYIDARLIVGVKLIEDDQLLNGDGIAPNILGLRARPGLAADIVRTGTETNADALLRQALAIFAHSYLMPDGFVLNPADWANTLLTKTTAGDYYTGGPFSPIQGAALWGLPVAVTPMMTPATGFVGAFKTAAQLFRRGGIRVEASNSHADFFIKNLVAIRAEERLALAVYRPGAFGEVTSLLGAAGVLSAPQSAPPNGRREQSAREQ